MLCLLCCLLFGNGVLECIEGAGNDGGEEGLDFIPLVHSCSSIGIAGHFFKVQGFSR